MDLSQLSVLHELAERGSVTAVAAASGRTPSAVSQQLRTLQRSVGIPLVERIGRGVRLTDAGVALARSAADIAAAVATAEAMWDAYRGEPVGTVRLSFFESAGEWLIAGLLTRLRAYPGIRVELTDLDVAQDRFASLTADHDIVIAHRSDDILPPDRSSVTVIALAREALDVALPLDHRFADRPEVRPIDVIDEPWISAPANFPLDRVLNALAAQVGRPARIVHRTTYLPLTEKLVAAGHGVALLPRHTTSDRIAGRFRLVPLATMRAGRQIEALLRPDKAARLAVQLVARELRGEAQALVERGAAGR